MRTSLTVAAGALSAAAWGLLAYASRQSTPPSIVLFLTVIAVASAAGISVFWVFAKQELPPSALAAVIGFALLFRLIGFLGQPLYEDDFYRYLWDGRTFALTGNPYQHPPADSFGQTELPSKFDEILSRINYPEIPTIYGPVCQLAFLLGYWISPGALWPLKLIFLAADLGILLLLFRLIGPSPALVIYAWSPLVIKEIAFTAHTDALAAAFVIASVLLAHRKRDMAAATALGLAVAARSFTIILVPLLLWKRWRALAVSILVAMALYAPFVASGASGGGSMKTFATQWEFNSFVYGLLKSFIGPAPALIACFALFAAFYVWFLKNSDDYSLLLGMFFLLSPVVNAWYLVLIVPFVALRPSAWGIAAVTVVLVSYATGANLHLANLGGYDHPWWVRPVEIIPIVIALVWDKRFWRQRSATTASLLV